jgi:hypothetical protein
MWKIICGHDDRSLGVRHPREAGRIISRATTRVTLTVTPVFTKRGVDNTLRHRGGVGVSRGWGAIVDCGVFREHEGMGGHHVDISPEYDCTLALLTAIGS